VGKGEIYKMLKMGRPPIIATSEALAEKVDEYFSEGCKSTRVDSQGNSVDKYIPTLSGLAVFLGYTREGFYRLADRGEDFLHIIKWAQSNIHSLAEENILSGDSCTGSIFWLKCNGNYVEKKEEEGTGKTHKFEISVT